MTIRLKTLPLTSDEILKELVRDSLPNLLGDKHELISDNLPFEGHHILALNADRKPVLVTYDSRDGGRALLSGLAAAERLSENRAMLYRLYPSLFRGSSDSSAIFRIEDLHLVILAPKPPPGGAYLYKSFRNLTTRSFRILEVDDKIGLLLESPCPDESSAASAQSGTEFRTSFRAGSIALTAEDENYLRRQ